MRHILFFFILFNFTFADILNSADSNTVNIGTLIQDDKNILSKKTDELFNKKLIAEVKKSEKNTVEQIIEEAFKLLGMKYVWGAVGPDKFDCSGFVLYVIEKSLNIKLPRVSSDMAAYKSNKLNYGELQKGDLVFFDTLNKNRVSHVGIYIGENKFIHAPNPTKKVMVSEFNSYYKKKFKWGIRL